MDEYKASPQKVYDAPAGTDHQIEVLDIFFGKQVLTPVYEELEEPAFAAKKGETEKKIRARFSKEQHLKKDETVIEYTPEKPFAVAKGGEKVSIKSNRRGKDKISFNRLSNTRLRKKVWLVAVCNAVEGRLTIEIRENKGTAPQAVYDDAVRVMTGDVEVAQIQFDLSKDKVEAPNIYVKEIRLQPKDKSAVDKLVEQFDKRSDKSASLYCKVEATGAPDDIIKYSSDNPEFLNENEKFLKILGTLCSCDRDFTTEKVKAIILKLRDNGSIKSRKLFDASNCTLVEADKSFERLTEELNKTFSKYAINTCLRKTHFLAQVYHETDRFQTTLEYSTQKDYSPYTGRGLMQLTWESNYKMFSACSGIDCVENINLISDDLYNATESAGWFWNQGKVLSVGKTWEPISDAPDYVKRNKPKYEKKEIKSKYKSDNTVKYGTIDFNVIADDDFVDVISYLVNGGSNGLQDRRDYVKDLKDLFDYPNCINKKE